MPRTPTAFYFDLASPLAYLAAERVLATLPGPAEWQPVLARELGGASCEAHRREREPSLQRDRIERRAHELGLQPMRWPEPFPFDSALAMRVATYAKSIGRAVPFALAAFRQAFAGGRNLEDPDSVVIAAAACEMHPAAVLRGAQLASVAGQLRSATRAAAARGVRDVPAVAVSVTGAGATDTVVVGERLLERAAAVMGAADAAQLGGPR